ncbi:MAG: HAMP domain-containing protein [Bacteroidales bacterium]
MKIKIKLISGIVFLFAEFMIVSLFSLYFIFKISQQSNLITKDNNLSIGFAENMLQSVDKINDIKSSSLFNVHYLVNENEFSGSLKNFEKNLINEENNITEIGEKELAKSVRDNFEKFKSLLSESVGNSVKDKPGFYFANLLPTINEIKFALFAISDLNMNAIVRKNVKANNTAVHYYLVLSIVATICFLVFFTFIFSFPKYIAEPIEILSRGTGEIANGNYEARVHFNTDDEFGQISKAFNEIAGKLELHEKIDIKKLISRKELAESVINRWDEPVLLLDVNQNIVLVNIPAQKLLGLSHLDITNKNASDLAANNELLKFMIRDLNQANIERGETYTLTSEGIRTAYTSEMQIITAFNKEKDLVVPIGYEISLKKTSKEFD